MIRTYPPIQLFTSESEEAALYPSLQNPAVALCVEIWQRIHKATMEQTKSPYTAANCAGKAYRLAMPPLTGYQNICDFIACAGYGMLIGAIKDENGTKLVYAAQVALSTIPKEDKVSSCTKSPDAKNGGPPPKLPYPPKNKRVRLQKPHSTP